MLTVQVLQSFQLTLGVDPMPACRPGDILVLDDAMAEGLISKRLVTAVKAPEPETAWTEVVPDGASENVGTPQPRRRANRSKKDDENGAPQVPAPSGEQG